MLTDIVVIVGGLLIIAAAIICAVWVLRVPGASQGIDGHKSEEEKIVANRTINSSTKDDPNLMNHVDGQ